MAAFTGSGKPNHVFLHSILFYDREPKINDPDTEAEHKVFDALGLDIFAQSEAGLLDSNGNVAAFNKELTRNSNLYASMIAEYHHNTQLVGEIVGAYPDSETTQAIHI
jgi:hypothetical protein